MYSYVLISVDTGFRGSHRDAAMPPPSADHASMEDRDPHPCPEDEEFFECRPDAADMEEAIGKFMEGMEKQESTGYAALHKLLAGLPVPVQRLKLFEGGNVYEVNHWLWMFGRGKPRLGGHSVAETAVRKSARHEEQDKRAVETRWRKKAAKASSK